MRSIRSRLILWMMGLVLLTWSAVVVFTWWSASSEIHEVFDSQLAQVARMLAVNTLHESEERDLASFVSELHFQKYQYPVIFQILTTREGLLIRGPNAPDEHLSADGEAGYSNAFVEGRQWRVYTLYADSEGGVRYRIQVAGEHQTREALILKFVLNILKPLLFLLPILVLFWIGIDASLKPLHWIARQVANRDQHNLEPLAITRVPEEAMVLVNEINALFQRLHASINRHSQFAANAAHELRTPLAGAMAQLGVAVDATGESERQRALEQTLQGLKRLGRRVAQLLTLARIEPEQIRPTLKPLDLESVTSMLLAERSPAALTRGIVFELQSDRRVMLKGNRELIEILLCNLLDNAQDAMQSGGRVTIRVSRGQSGVTLSVEDSGPGIPEEKLEGVFDRHHRLENIDGNGFGLGLSIVQEIAEVHQASVVLANRHPEAGLLVTVQFPG